MTRCFQIVHVKVSKWQPCLNTSRNDVQLNDEKDFQLEKREKKIWFLKARLTKVESGKPESSDHSASFVVSNEDMN